MYVPDEVRKCAVFLGTPDAGNPNEIVPRCTGFLVGVPPTHSVPGKAHVYLVTAKHYVDAIQGQRSGVRLNFTSGDARTCWFDAAARWWFHPTESDSVDVAVLPTPLPDGHDHLVVETPLFATDRVLKEANIGAGNEVFLPGLFTRSPGRKRNTPIVRTGTVAAFPEDTVPIWLAGRNVGAEVYLIEVRSMGGLSGSPIFVTETVSITLNRTAGPKSGEKVVMAGTGSFYFLGIMHGHWNIRPDEHNRYDFRATSVDESIALGISVVVPAKKILDIIEQPAFVEQRARDEQTFLEQMGTTSTT